MKKLAYRVDPDFTQYITQTDPAGHLPNLGISGYTTARAPFDYSFEEYQALDAPHQASIAERLMASPAYHHLCSTAIAFWPRSQCFKCGKPYIPHGYVAKRVSMLEQIEALESVGPRGPERIGLCTPVIQYSGVGAPLAFMPYACEYMDRVLLGVWKAVETDAKLRGMLDSPPATLSYATSSLYGGRYWGLQCPHCASLQGEFFLKPTQGNPNPKAMAGMPELLVLPKLQGEDTFGGKVIGRLTAATWPPG